MFSAAAEYSNVIPHIIHSWRPVAVVLFPFSAAVITFLLERKSGAFASLFAVLASALSFLFVLSLYPLLRQGTLEYLIGGLMGTGLLFRADYLSFIFALLISLAWLLAMFYALAALEEEEQRRLYFPFSLITLGSCLGVVLTGDLISLFLFFELMTFSSYILVISRRSKEALAAGAFTLYLGLAGGLVMLFGIIALFSTAGTVALAPLMEKMAEGGANLSFIFICLFIGFGIKAVVVPLHLWIPRAYAAAPAAVNALSSGAMIKAGIYGILRLLFVLFTPPSLKTAELFNFARTAGYVIIWLGLLTIVAGAIMALQQDHIMKLLAYSSVSQMGYIITGIGAGAYLFGLEEAMGYSGAVLHAFNHTLFKVAFILIAGIVYYCCGELKMEKLGGLWKKIPLAAVFFILSVLAISGVPGFNGYISKTLIHDALLEAHHHYGGLDIYLAEKIFVLGSALTLCYYLKFFQGVFSGASRPAVMQRRPPFLLYFPLFILVPLMLVVGLFPNYILEGFVLPSAKVFTFEPYSIKHIIGFHFFDNAPLEAALLVLLLGLLLYLPAVRLHLLTRPLPRWFSVEYLLFVPLVRLVYGMLLRAGGSLERSVNGIYYGLASRFMDLCTSIDVFDRGVDGFYNRSSYRIRYLVESFRQVDDTLNEAYEATGKAARELAGRTTELDSALDKSYERAGDYARRLATRTGELDEALDNSYERAGDYARRLATRTGELDEALDQGYEKAGLAARRLVEKRTDDENATSGTGAGPEPEQRKGLFTGINPLEWNIRNISFDSLLIAVMLGLVIFVLLFFARGLVNL
ncbi:MAG: proton-conducting transporter membrane subunit [Bacillota bacterium]